MKADDVRAPRFSLCFHKSPFPVKHLGIHSTTCALLSVEKTVFTVLTVHLQISVSLSWLIHTKIAKGKAEMQQQK